MCRRAVRQSVVLLVAALAAAPATAETLGTLSFTFDGDTTAWITRSRESRGKIRTSAELTKGKLFDTLDLTAYPDGINSPERFSIALVYSHGPVATRIESYGRPSDITILRLLGDITGPRWEARNIQLDYALTETSAKEGSVKGQFQAEFCYIAKVYADADESSCRPGSGSFDTAFKIVEDD